ncbi:MAG TPA: hypothetical protein VMS17_13570 [Gemmataceae bacterium]|nr:hypothetical protein [Gemmataceae bacterium]
MSQPSSWLGKLLSARRCLPAMLYLCLLLCLSSVLVWRPLHGYLDYWMHAAVGRWICEHGEIPRRTLFLWTANEPWVYHEWLSQLVFYGLARLAGEQGLPYVVLGFTMAMVALSFLPAWAMWARRGRISAWVIVPFFLYLDASFPRFQPRPELFTIVFLGVLLRAMCAWSARPPGKVDMADLIAAAAFLPLFALWANFHGGVMAGLIFLGTTAACDLVQDRFSRRARILALLTPLAVLAVTANPYGFQYWLAFQPVGSQLFAHIQEWQPLWRLSEWPMEIVIEDVLLTALALLAWIVNPARRWAQLAWLIAAVGMFASAVRNSWLLALVSLTTLAANGGALDPLRLWDALSRRINRRTDGPAPPVPAYLRWLVRLGLTAWLAMQVFIRWNDVLIMNALMPEKLAQGAIQFIREQRPTGRMFADSENASFLDWQFGGDPPVFADALDAYPDAVLRDYIDIAVADDRGRKLLQSDWLDWVLLTTNRPGPSLAPLANYLDRSSDWMRVYAGGDGAIWVRRTPEAERRWAPLLGSVTHTSFETMEFYNRRPIR